MPFTKTGSGDYYYKKASGGHFVFVGFEGVAFKNIKIPDELIGKRLRLKLEVVK